jgi:hypothetical protein
MGQIMKAVKMPGIMLGINVIKGGDVSDQPICLKCGKVYFKNNPKAEGGCKCPEEERKILKDVH